MATTLGTVLLSLAELSGDGGHRGVAVEALGVALLCRAASALMMVSLRSPGMRWEETGIIYVYNMYMNIFIHRCIYLYIYICVYVCMCVNII